jgi:hypothetical protein
MTKTCPDDLFELLGQSLTSLAGCFPRVTALALTCSVRKDLRMLKAQRTLLTTIFTLVVLVTGSLPTYVTATAQNFSVTSVVLKVHSSTNTGQCPVSFTFDGAITTDGPGTVQYVFTRSDGATGPVQTLEFKSAGTQQVSTTWIIGDAKSLTSYEGWQALKIISPNEVESSRDTGSFVMKCGQQGEAGSKPEWTEKVLPKPQAPQPSSSIDNTAQTQIINGQYTRVPPITNKPAGGYPNSIDSNGNPRTSESTGPPDPLSGNFKVTLNGYKVDRQTRDDMFERDGVGDEVTLVLNLATIDSSGRFVPQRWGNIFSSFMGQQPRNEIRAGSGTERGGLVTGDGFPTATPWRRLTPINPGIPPNILFEGELTQGVNAALVIPTIWESDNTGALRGTFASSVERDRPAITSAVTRMITSSIPAVPGSYLMPGSSLGIGNTVTLGTGPLGLGQVDDRPIGMTAMGGGFGFTPQAMVLTYDGARVLARADFGFGRGVIPVRYQDDRRLEGDYTLFIQVEETSGLAAGPCAAPLSAAFVGTATMTTTNKNAPGPFTSDIRLSLSFEDCRSTLRITEFPAISVTFGTPIGDNTTTVTLPSGGSGTFAAGRVEIPVSLRFGNSIPAAGTSFADMTLTTASGGGAALRAGSLTLVGSGRFRGGFLNGSNCRLSVTGTITPAP